MTWENLKKANGLSERRPVPENIIEQLKVIADSVDGPIEQTLIRNIISMYIVYREDNGNFDDY